ncbi:FkbM family methyltransferase [Brevundimonas sp. AAP58]|uniref:FkbM family methyltransferase n=1 Tax=Brevundimonas sp. AAP58 TaxID=1523422 RepID=UPI0006B89C12|nr:FkbM family methyltransferase [Brevundimonas sp. AAP58]
MPIYSYSQAHEDVILFRALKDVGIGHYVDVGAGDPALHSVTLLFYERGWRGVNIEPLPEQYQHLLAHRPHDVNLCAAAGSKQSEITLYRTRGNLELSTSDPVNAARAASVGCQVDEISVQSVTLNDVLDSVALHEVHFLKIDVEGSEAAVLQGLDLSRHRPWIIVVEAHAPMSRTETHGEWEPMLLAAAYDFVFYDGLNRYYLRQESQALQSRFYGPANPFDDYIDFWTLGDPLTNPAHPDRDWVRGQLANLHKAAGLGASTDLQRYMARLPEGEGAMELNLERLAAVYRAVLDRDADPAGVTFFLEDPQRAFSVEEAYRLLIDSHEYSAKRVRSLRQLV